MTGLMAFTALVALVGLERLAELVVSTRNAAWSFARGGVEYGRGHYPVMVALHSGFLVAMLLEAWVRRPDVPAVLAWSMLALVIASQALRWWCIGTLGRRWNTRVIVVPGLAPVTSSTYASYLSSGPFAAYSVGPCPSDAGYHQPDHAGNWVSAAALGGWSGRTAAAGGRRSGRASSGTRSARPVAPSSRRMPN